MDRLASVFIALIFALGYAFLWFFEKLLGAWVNMKAIFKSHKTKHSPRSKEGFVVDIKNKKVIDTPGKSIPPFD